MNTHEDMAMTLGQAIATWATDGYHISIGGFTINRNPIAAVYELMWQRKKIFIAAPIQMVPTLMNYWRQVHFGARIYPWRQWDNPRCQRL